MRISVFGIGYVGAVTSACLSNSGHEVIAVDTDPVKVECILSGCAPIVETSLDELIAKGIKNGKLTAMLNVNDAVLNTEISLICVGTPSNKDGSLDLSYVKSLCATIGKILANKDSYHTIVLRSTMLPGSAMDVALPILERESGKKAGAGFGFGNNPEFLREGTAIFDFHNPPKIVVGALDERTAKKIMALYEGIDSPRVVAEIPIAEGVKYADNAWHAAKIGFANEIGNILNEHGLDSHKVMDIFCLDTKLNISKAYMRPGFAFGGSCLPKDIRSIRASAKIKGLKTPFFDSLLQANDQQVTRAYKMVKDAGYRKIGLLGLSFKAGTDDLRESPLVLLADLLLKDGFDVKIYDPFVYEAKRMNGANQRYICEEIPHISRCLVENPQGLTEGTDLFIIGNRGGDFANILDSVDSSKPIIDLVRLGAPFEKRDNYKGICW